MSLFSNAELERAHERYMRQQQEQPQPKTKAEILVEVVAEFPDATVAELATASGMSPSWVRRTLKKAGITLATARRSQQKEETQQP